MTTDERLMFHLTDGALRRWSLWNEGKLPEWAIGEERKYELFQDWKKNPFKETSVVFDGQPQVMLHTMSDFNNWPYWLIIDLICYAFPSRIGLNELILEPEQLKEDVCESCDDIFSEHEKQTISQLSS